MIWVLAFIITGVISFFLTLRSMRDYQESSQDVERYALFHLSKSRQLNREIILQLYQLSLEKKCSISIEKLIKGDEEVLLAFLPEHAPKLLPHLHLIEIEDYLQSEDLNSVEDWVRQKQISLNDSFTFVLHKAKDQQIEKLPLGELDVEGFIGLQCVLKSIQSEQDQIFQSTFRCIVQEVDTLKRVQIVKQLKEQILQKAHLVPEAEMRNINNFSELKSRVLVPVQVEKRALEFEDLLKLF